MYLKNAHYILLFISQNFSVYSGHHSTLIPPAEFEQNAAVWLSTISNKKSIIIFLLYKIYYLFSS